MWDGDSGDVLVQAIDEDGEVLLVIYLQVLSGQNEILNIQPSWRCILRNILVGMFLSGSMTLTVMKVTRRRL